MAVKLPDTLVPMADFPSAFAKDVQFTDGENLQDKLDKGKLGSSSSGTGLTEEQANNIEKIPSIEGIVTSNSQVIANKADKDHEHTEYLTEIPDEYVTDTKLFTELDKKVNKEVDKGLSTNDLTNELVIKINSSATEAFVTNAIANAQLDGGDVDLSGYATVDALNLKADLTHTHDQYLTKVPDEYITETELNVKGYLTLPSGAVIPFAGSTAPQGYLLCDGSEVSRADYPYLFDTIGTTYGEGDGSTTFNLPNLKDRFVQGAGANTVGTKKSAGLPNITGSFSITGNDNSGAWGTGTGAFIATRSDNNHYFSSEKSTGTSIKGYNFNASETNSIYGKSTTVQPPAVVMNYIIKY